MAHPSLAARRSLVLALTAVVACFPSIARAQPASKGKEVRAAAPSAGPSAADENDGANERKLDAVLRAWARGGSAGSRGAIVTAASAAGDLTAVADLIPAMGGLLKKT